MRIDIYTKAVLTAIALFLGVIAFRPVFSPDSVAHAQGSFAGIQFTGPAGTFFDSRTGDIYEYYLPGRAIGHYKLTKLGAEIVEAK